MLKPILLMLFCLVLLVEQSAYAQQSRYAATINGEVLTEFRVRQSLKTWQIDENEQPDAFNKMRDRLIDQALIRQFLNERGITAPAALMERTEILVDQILAQETSPEQALKKLNMSRKELLAELSLPLAWRRYVRQVVTEDELKEHFARHQLQYDGTTRRARQIFLKRSAEQTDGQQELQQLLEIKRMIESETITFVEAARKYSQSPSADQGGNLGTFAFTGQMPREISEVVFQTEVGKLSEPFTTQYGAHLILVEEEFPGQFSLEDARPELFQYFEQKLWKATVDRLRKSGEVILFDLS